MTKTEMKIFRLKDEIRILNDHLSYEENPDKYSLKISKEERQKNIAFISSRIAKKQEEINQLINQEL